MTNNEASEPHEADQAAFREYSKALWGTTAGKATPDDDEKAKPEPGQELRTFYRKLFNRTD